MDNVLALGLALAFVFFVLKFNKRHRKKSLSQLSYSQSSIHNIIKDFIPKRLFERPEVVSQSRKHTEKHMVKIIVLDNNAYWVKDNIFYTAKTKNGNIIDETVKPVDIENMSNSPNPEFSPENTSQAVTKTKTKNAIKR